MNSNKCRQVRREIDELDISQQPGEGAMAHLASCSACAQFRLERANLREMVGGLKPVVAPADFDMRLRARLARERSGAERQPFFTRLIGMPAIAAAAMVVLTVGAVVWIGQRDSNQTTQVAVQNPTAPVASQQAAGTVPQNVPPATPPDSDGGKELALGPKVRRNKPERHVRSTDYGLNSAESVRANDSFVNAPSKTVVVSFEDDNGTKRNVKLPPVSFGAQSLVDNRVPATYMGNSRVW